jgi:NAD(P)-dependent dehydrogenase (short-subunit alcohol dehydrogenase family)
METNVAGSALIAESFAPLLSNSSNPRVIFMSSGLGSIGTQAELRFHKDWPAYSSSKAALNMLMLWFAQKYPEWRVNACCPGFRATNLNNYGESTNNAPGKLEDGALNAVRLTLLEKDGETGTFTQRNDETGEIRTLPW